MRLEVVPQLALCDEDHVEELLDLRVPHLGVGQDLADEVHRTLYLQGMAFFLPFHYQGCADDLRCGCYVEEERLAVNRRN